MITALLGRNESGGQSHAKIAHSGRLGVIEYAHLAVHEDEFVFASHHDTDVDTGAPLVVLVTPDTSYDIHGIFNVTATKPVKIELYETNTTDITSNGTLLTHCRMKRYSTVGDTDRAVTYYAPTVADTGTLLFETHSGGSTGSQGVATPVGGGARNGEEFNFRGDDKSYLLYIRPNISNTQVSILHEYYEVAR